MKMINNVIVVYWVIVGLGFTALQCGEKIPMYYYDSFISPEFVVDQNAGPQPPANVKAAIEQWADEHQELLRALTVLPCPLSTFTQSYEQNKALLQEYGIAESSDGGYNYIFKVPIGDDIYYVKIAGTEKRVAALWARTHKKSGHVRSNLFRTEDIDCMPMLPTYFTLSRRAYYLLVEQALQDIGARHVITAPTYVAHVPGRPYDATDENWFVYQKSVGPLKRLHRDKEFLKICPADAIEELYYVLKKAACWDIHMFAQVKDPGEERKVVVLDFEMFEKRMEKFFTVNAALRNSYINVSLGKLGKITAKYPHLWERFKAALENKNQTKEQQ